LIREFPDQDDGSSAIPAGARAAFDRIPTIPSSLGVERVVRAMSVARPDPRFVTIEGPATIYEVSALRETLREELAAGNDIRIDLGDSGKWDLAGLQLLVSCVRTGESRGQTIRLTRIPRICVEIAERSGLAEWLEKATD